MARYISIIAIQRPFDIGPDDNDRAQRSFNIVARATAPVAEFTREMAKKLEDAGLGTRGEDIYMGRIASVPQGDGPFIYVIDTGGIQADQTHDDVRTENLTAQIFVRARRQIDCQTRALAAWNELDRTYEETITL